MKISICVHKAKYPKSQWFYYWYPRRLTMKCSPAIYKWLFWVFGLKGNSRRNKK